MNRGARERQNSLIETNIRLKEPGPRPDTHSKIGMSRRTRSQTAKADSGKGLHVCPSCGSPLVQPSHWFERGDGHWHVELRCPECEWRGHGTYSQREVDRYDEELDEGSQQLLEELRSLVRDNMEEEANRFAVALADDRILPEDF
jgi:hypothetical protein